MDAKSTTCSSKGTLPSGEELPNEISEVLPKAGLVYSEKGSLGDILCKPKILPLKSITLEVLESLSESQSGDVKRAASEEGEQNQRQGLGVLRAEREVGVASVGTTTEATSRESGQQGAGEEGQHKRQQGGRGQRTEREVVGVGVGVSRAAAATIQTQAISRESRPADSSFPPPSAAEAVSGSVSGLPESPSSSPSFTRARDNRRDKGPLPMKAVISVYPATTEPHQKPF